MPSYLDLALIAIVLVSGVLSLLRGFTREVLAIASWAAAAFAAFYLHPMLLPFVTPHIAKESIALAIAIGAIFLVTLIVVSMIAVRISDAILDSKIGALDRSLGFIFGSARGLLLCVVAFLFFNWLVPEKTQPDWVREAKMRPMLESGGETLVAMLPEDPLSAFQQRMKRNRNGETAPEEPELRTAPGRRS